jgi:hypothetical protein
MVEQYIDQGNTTANGQLSPLSAEQRRIWHRARKFGYDIRRNPNGTYVLASEGCPIFRQATLIEVDAFLRRWSLSSSRQKKLQEWSRQKKLQQQQRRTEP